MEDKDAKIGVEATRHQSPTHPCKARRFKKRYRYVNAEILPGWSPIPRLLPP